MLCDATWLTPVPVMLFTWQIGPLFGAFVITVKCESCVFIEENTNDLLPSGHMVFMNVCTIPVGSVFCRHTIMLMRHIGLIVSQSTTKIR